MDSVHPVHARKESEIHCLHDVRGKEITASGKIKNQQIIDRCEELTRIYREKISGLFLEVNRMDIDSIVQYKVILKDEVGSEKTVDGYLFTASFEQRTPTGSTAQNFKKALEHATDKNADVLVAYMKGNGHTQKSVEDGIRKFEPHNSKRFKQIIIVTEKWEGTSP